jgi:hypothetical protein
LKDTHPDIITRLRDDMALCYRHTGPGAQGRGRRNTFAGNVDVKNPDPGHLTVCCEEPGFRRYKAVVLCKAFKRRLKVALMHELDTAGKVRRVKICASTDLQLTGHRVFIYYKRHFQMKFQHRDANGHKGLEHCQRRNLGRMNFHHNLSTTAVSVARALHWYNLGEQRRGAFSISNIKARYYNELMPERFFCAFGKTADPLKNHPRILFTRNFGDKAIA